MKVLVSVLFQGCEGLSRAFVAEETSCTIGPPSSKVLAPPWRGGRGSPAAGCPAVVDVESSMRPRRNRGLRALLGQVPFRPSHNLRTSGCQPSPAWWCQRQPSPLGDKMGELKPAELSHSEAAFVCMVQLLTPLHLECRDYSMTKHRKHSGERYR